MDEQISAVSVGQVAGALLTAFILLDVLLTVLYARLGAGLASLWIARAVWRLALGISRPFGRHRGAVLTLCGPVVLVAILGFWALALTLGAALVIHPVLGTAVQASSGATPTDFITALYAGGSSMAIVGASDFGPRTSGFRLFYLFNSLVGMSVTSLTLTYLMQVYTALRLRNSLGLKIDVSSGRTGDAVELLAGLGPEGQFNSGYTNLSQIATLMTEVKEVHHFYPVLFYFRFREPYYAVSRFGLMSLDTVALLKSGLDDEKFAWLKESATVTELEESTGLVLRSLTETFLSGRALDDAKCDERTAERWRRRYFRALERLRQAGIETVADERAGAEDYIALRHNWYRYIAALAPAMAYQMDEIDPLGIDPEIADGREPFRVRRRTALEQLVRRAE